MRVVRSLTESSQLARRVASDHYPAAARAVNNMDLLYWKTGPGLSGAGLGRLWYLRCTTVYTRWPKPRRKHNRNSIEQRGW